MKFEVYHVVDASEPMQCRYGNSIGKECDEELNGLNLCWIEVMSGFDFEIWLCSKHFAELKMSKKVKVRR